MNTEAPKTLPTHTGRLVLATLEDGYDVAVAASRAGLTEKGAIEAARCFAEETGRVWRLEKLLARKGPKLVRDIAPPPPPVKVEERCRTEPERDIGPLFGETV